MRRPRKNFLTVTKPRSRFSLNVEGVKNEGELQARLCKWLDVALPRDWRYFATLNGVALGGSIVSRSKRINAAKARGLKPGTPDLIFLRRDGLRWCAAELKFGKRPTTDEQDEWIAWAGGNIATANCREKLAEFLNRHGVGIAP